MASDRSSVLRLRTALCDLLGIRCPLVQAPLPAGTGPDGRRMDDARTGFRGV